ncbi:hypothetical protein Tco_0487386 [Tanacetum coccineum]
MVVRTESPKDNWQGSTCREQDSNSSTNSVLTAPRSKSTFISFNSSKQGVAIEWGQLVLRLRRLGYQTGPSHKKDNNLSAEKEKGHSKKKEQKAHHIGQQHQQLKLTAGFKQKIGEPEKGRSPFYMKKRSGFEASLRFHALLQVNPEYIHRTNNPPVKGIATIKKQAKSLDSETAIVVNRSKAREREVSDAKGNSSMKASVVITRSSCLIDSPSIIQSRKQSQRPLEKDDFYFKILSWIVKKPKGKKEKQRQRRCLLHRPLTIYPRSFSLRQRDSLFLEQARRYQDKILAEAKKEARCDTCTVALNAFTLSLE